MRFTALLFIAALSLLLSGCGEKREAEKADKDSTGSSVTQTDVPSPKSRARKTPVSVSTQGDVSTPEPKPSDAVTTEPPAITPAAQATSAAGTPLPVATATPGPVSQSLPGGPRPPLSSAGATSLAGLKQRLAANGPVPTDAQRQEIQNDLNVLRDTVQDAAYSKDVREEIEEMAGKIEYQLDEMSKSNPSEARANAARLVERVDRVLSSPGEAK